MPAHAAVVLAVGLAPRGGVRKGHSSRALELSAGEPLARHIARLALETAPSQLLVCVPADDHTAVEVALRGLRLRCLPVPGGGLGPALVAALRALPRDCAAALALLCDPLQHRHRRAPGAPAGGLAGRAGATRRVARCFRRRPSGAVAARLLGRSDRVARQWTARRAARSGASHQHGGVDADGAGARRRGTHGVNDTMTCRACAL